MFVLTISFFFFAQSVLIKLFFTSSCTDKPIWGRKVAKHCTSTRDLIKDAPLNDRKARRPAESNSDHRDTLPPLYRLRHHHCPTYSFLRVDEIRSVGDFKRHKLSDLIPKHKSRNFHLFRNDSRPWSHFLTPTTHLLRNIFNEAISFKLTFK